MIMKNNMYMFYNKEVYANNQLLKYIVHTIIIIIGQQQIKNNIKFLLIKMKF